MADPVSESLQRTLGEGVRVERELGDGGMSRVFLATDISLDRQVVIKVLSPELAAGVSAERFRREIQLVAKLQHPHVVPILSAGEADGTLFYVMPFLSGESLRARLAREGRLPVKDTVQVLREMLDALSFAHRSGVVHRDIKPENILSGAGHAVIADFGVSKALKDAASQTTAGIALGTPAYMAPEQIAADPNTDQRADIYATGVVAYEMLTGAPPFSGTSGQLLKSHLSETPAPIASKRSDIPPALAAVIMRALEKDPARRPQNAQAMISELDAASSPAVMRVPKGAVFAGLLIAIGALTGVWVIKRPMVAANARFIAVAPFGVADGDTALVRLGQNLVTTISANIDGLGDIRTADPMAMLSQAKLVGSTLTQSDAERIARKIGAQSVVYGTLTRTDGKVRLVANLSDVNNPGRTPNKSLDFTVPGDSISLLTDSLTWQLLRDIWQKGEAPTPYATSLFTRSPKALREFLDGEQLFARGGVAEAAVAYERAIAEDTTFWFAHYRYEIARGWMALPLDTIITHRLARNLRKLPQRELMLMLARDSSATLRERVKNLKFVLDRYPDYTPALLGYADVLSHHAMRVGYDAKDAIEPWKRLADLLPSDMESASHVAWGCASTGDLDCAERFAHRLDSLVHTDSALFISRLQSAAFRFVFPGSAYGRTNSNAPRDSFPSFMSSFTTLMFADAIARDRQILTEHDKQRSAAIPGMPAAERANARLDMLFANAIRGAVASVDSALGIVDQVPPLVWQGPALSVTRPSLLRMRVLSELQGLLPPDTATAVAALAIADNSSLGTAARNEMRWIAAANAMARGDSTALKARIAEFARDSATSRTARVAIRSLRGIALGRNGNRRAAAESLLALERVHSDSAGTVWGALGADRLFAADWLTEQKKFEAADSLLRFTEGYTFGPLSETSGSIYGAAMIQRARIAEARGDTAAALRFTRNFLATYDHPAPTAKTLVEEAQARAKRLNRVERK